MNLDALRSFLEILYFIAGIGLFFVASIALQQIWIAKTDIKTRIYREAAKEAAVQITHWADVIIPSMNKLISYQNKIPFQRLSCSMERFDMEELDSQDSKARSHQQKAVDLLMKDSEFGDLTLDAVNLVEASAVYFCTGVADEEMAFMPLSAVFCDFVERTFFFYCSMRKQDHLNRWDYTVKLYRVWSQRRIKHDLDAQHNTLTKSLVPRPEHGQDADPRP